MIFCTKRRYKYYVIDYFVSTKIYIYCTTKKNLISFLFLLLQDDNALLWSTKVHFYYFFQSTFYEKGYAKLTVLQAMYV